ncbi:hypothetical protein Ctob_010655 [Chrysochromulina tobinii]|uniref:Fibronectin type-III domain-containing protein n=1 Tax=Chrysochromulina tobinii TaxID=1460289 RepID=A0A0M0K8P2_9EUKA|nr:hypothetical protein Ctob_010655 [Chrysochromulina tobinii]|eukprot:KOO34768.1 hypothetical protein Ctob_010655 [Chrysochromulina sp. CCMP291]
MTLAQAGTSPVRGAELIATTAPAAPSGLEVTEVTDSSIALKWNRSPGADVRYAVYGSAALGFNKVYTGAEAHCTITGLTKGKEYGFRVCAMNGQGGASDFGQEVTVNYTVELAEGDGGVVAEGEEWTVIYEGAPPGCEISYLAPETEYHMRVNYKDHSGRTHDFGPSLIVTTPEEPAKPKKASQLERLKEQKKQFLDSLSSQAGAPLREKAGIAMSPRSRSNAAPLGGSTPRPDLWLGSHAAAGPTTDKALPASPRGSVAGRTSQAGASELGDEKPGPGAYNSTSDFKPADRLRKDPSKGSASSFKSKTKRLFDFDGAVIDTTLHPGKKLSDAPGVGTYSPADMGSIEKVAEALKRRAAKLATLRRNKDIKEPNRFQSGTLPPAATPGPGAYDTDRLAKAKEERQYGAKFMAFKSGSRRALPWGGRGSDAPQSIRARKCS